MSNPENTVTIIATESKNLDTTCYRGSAPLEALARISQADVFDQVTNPEGLQRDLSVKHANEAYAYVAREKDPKMPRAYPEVVLNVRDRKVVQREILFEGGEDPYRIVSLTFDVDKILAARNVKVSRVDGNHRLMWAAGDAKDRTPITLSAPFQLHIGLSREQETSLFTDMNAEQKGLNTSHLAVLRSRITPEDIELELHPSRVFARRLATDSGSPWYDLVHMGGSKTGTKAEGKYRPVNFVALEHGVQRTLRKSGYLGEREHSAQYQLIADYWRAVKQVFPEAWENPRDFLILKNLGVQVFSQLAATVIDRCVIAGNLDVGYMVPFLQAAKGRVDWHKDSADTAGMSGNRAALMLSGEMSKGLPQVADQYVDISAPAEDEAEQPADEAEVAVS